MSLVEVHAAQQVEDSGGAVFRLAFVKGVRVLELGRNKALNHFFISKFGATPIGLKRITDYNQLMKR